MPLELPLPAWLRDAGPDADVVLSTRCRIARNLADAPFPWRAGERQRREAAHAIVDAAHRAGAALARSEPISRDILDEDDLASLLEHRYASREWAYPNTQHPTPNTSTRFLLIAPDGAASLMINEEDHLRLQAIRGGLLVESVLGLVEREERALAAVLLFAQAPGIGHLTASLVNAGAGLRLSVLLHLPGLARSGELGATLRAAYALGASVRGRYGEGSSGTGDLYQVSNMCSFGLEPRQIAERVSAAAASLVEAERRARIMVFGGRAARQGLAAAVERTVQRLLAADLEPEPLLEQVAGLRLAVAEGIVAGDLAQTAEWIAIAGAGVEADPSRRRFEAIRRTAALRQRLRATPVAELPGAAKRK